MKKEWMEFIRKAKQSTYASNFSIPKKTLDGGKRYRIEKGNLIYTDTYFGSLVDCGQERFYVDGQVVWIMAYRGGTIKGKENFSKKAFSFLKKCIATPPKDFPARGPKKVRDGDWFYENKYEGDFDGFVGEENIYFKKEKICFRNYLGGFIKN